MHHSIHLIPGVKHFPAVDTFDGDHIKDNRIPVYGQLFGGDAQQGDLATVAHIEAQDWSLNPGRYVGVAEEGGDDGDFAIRLGELNEELEVLNSEARELEELIANNIPKVLDRL